MIRIIQLLIFGHIHKWKTENKVEVYGAGDRSMPKGWAYVQQCEHCGDVRRKDLT